MKKIITLICLLTLTTNLQIVNATSTLNCEQTLIYNDTGTNIETLQKELNTTSNCNLDIDGIFGPQTKNCVQNFQKKYNLETDGIVGAKTCQKLNNIYKIESKKNYVVITASKLNIRKNSSLNSKILGVFSKTFKV